MHLAHPVLFDIGLESQYTGQPRDDQPSEANAAGPGTGQATDHDGGVHWVSDPTVRTTLYQRPAGTRFGMNVEVAEAVDRYGPQRQQSTDYLTCPSRWRHLPRHGGRPGHPYQYRNQAELTYDQGPAQVAPEALLRFHRSRMAEPGVAAGQACSQRVATQPNMTILLSHRALWWVGCTGRANCSRPTPEPSTLARTGQPRDGESKHQMHHQTGYHHRPTQLHGQRVAKQ